MKRSTYTESQIVFACNRPKPELRSGKSAEDGNQRDHIYNWKKFGRLGTTELRRLRQLEEENNQLKKLVADLSLDKYMLQEVLQKKL